MTRLADVNAMTAEGFVAAFGDVAEHSPWVAAQAFAARPFANRDALIAAFDAALDAAPRSAQLDLVRAHPDLATRAKLTSDSTREQAGAGLDTLNAAEFQRFTELNTRYRQRFGFPFIFAVKGANKHQILDSFAQRIDANNEDEFATALTQVKRIFRFRLEDRVAV